MARITKVSAQRSRQGAAIAEFAVCLPIIILIVFATLEATEMIFLKQSLTISAYEGARVALVPEVEDGSVEVVCQNILDDRRISNATIVITPSNISAAPVGTYISVDVSAPAVGNVFSAILTRNTVVNAHVEMMKEF